MKILLLDNYDSFTYNLADYLSQNGASPIVKRNDAITLAEIRNLKIAAIVISPGPKRPEDAGITMDLIHHFHAILPILGVCLGYQALGAYFGASVVRSPLPQHGKTSKIDHNSSGLFKNIPSPTEVMRYHSLNIAEIPTILEMTAFTQLTNEPMALQHKTLPLAGVQFHPESVLTPHGKQLLANWLDSLPR